MLHFFLMDNRWILQFFCHGMLKPVILQLAPHSLSKPASVVRVDQKAQLRFHLPCLTQIYWVPSGNFTLCYGRKLAIYRALIYPWNHIKPRDCPYCEKLPEGMSLNFGTAKTHCVLFCVIMSWNVYSEYPLLLRQRPSSDWFYILLLYTHLLCDA